MSVVIPDDLWRQVCRHTKRASRHLGEFIQSHPDEKCIAPTGEELLALKHLVKALHRANREEKGKKPS